MMRTGKQKLIPAASPCLNFQIPLMAELATLPDEGHEYRRNGGDSPARGGSGLSPALQVLLRFGSSTA